jgi:hypothetical protein
MKKDAVAIKQVQLSRPPLGEAWKQIAEWANGGCSNRQLLPVARPLMKPRQSGGQPTCPRHN